MPPEWYSVEDDPQARLYAQPVLSVSDVTAPWARRHTWLVVLEMPTCTAETAEYIVQIDISRGVFQDARLAKRY